MTKKDKISLADAYEHLVSISLNQVPIDGLEDLVHPQIMGWGTTLAEEVNSIEGYVNLIKHQETSAREFGLEFNFDRQKISGHISESEDTAIFIEKINTTIKTNGIVNQFMFRFSAVMTLDGDDWKLIHWHGSIPTDADDDVWHINELQRRNEELEELVKERTRQLERKNRDMEIEAALEHVRARSLAMKNTSELQEVVLTVFNKMQDLGINMDSVSLNIIDRENHQMDLWTGAPELASSVNIKLDYFDHPILTDYFKAVEKGQDLMIKTYSPEVKRSYFEQLFRTPKLRRTPEARKQLVLQDAPFTLTVSIGEYSSLHLNSYTGKGYTDEHHDILKRFNKVFDQAYTRYLDLENAEKRNFQAQVENTLERVRELAITMNHSEDIYQVAGRILDELDILHISGNRSGIAILNKADESLETWTSTLDKSNTVIKSKTIPVSIHPMLEKGFKAWAKNEVGYQYELSGKELTDFYDNIIKYGPDIPHYKLPGEINQTQFWYSTIFKSGMLYYLSDNEEEESTLAMLERFGDVFQLAYTRYEDLQKSEEQAAGALRQASLDRLRAEITSMRTTKDLERITPLIWKELTMLDVPFFRCGVFIIDEEEQIINTYLSDPEGKPQAVLNLPIDSNELTKNTYKYWKTQTIYFEKWGKEEFINWVRSLVVGGHIPSSEHYGGSQTPPESLALHFIPFEQGMLYVGSADKLNDEPIKLVKQLANAFAVAYARYEDFKNLDNALTRLKATQNQMVQQEKLASLGQLTAGIAHEIKNPLNFVNNFSELNIELVDELKELIEEALPERNDDTEEMIDLLGDIKSNLQKVFEHGSRADGIVKSMLLHSRGGSGQKQPTNLNALVKEYVNLAFHGMRASKTPFNTDIEFDFDENIGTLPLIVEDFSRVILNLTNNAFDAMRDKLNALKQDSDSNDYKPKLTARSKKTNGTVIVEIEDNGPGIPQAQIEKVLQPFFTTKKGTDGTGLGLSITNDIIKAHGGELSVSSKEDEGACFTIQLTLTR